MTEEEKKLLLIDISPRLPYKVNVLANTSRGDKTGYIVTVTTKFYYYSKYDEILGEFYSRDGDECFWLDCGLFKPYLRPMSSMTEEELNGLLDGENSDFDGKSELVKRAMLAWAQGDKLLSNALFSVQCAKTVDWLNAHHFDYRGLIEKGLALEAPEGMYKND